VQMGIPVLSSHVPRLLQLFSSQEVSGTQISLFLW